MSPYPIVFLAALGLALALTHRVRRGALAWGLLDHPDGERRIHTQPIPRVGGIAIFASTMVVALLAMKLWDIRFSVAAEEVRPLIALVIGSVSIFALGLWDDVRSLRARTKALIQTVVAAGVFFMGVRIGGMTLPGGEALVFPLWLSFLLTVGWLVVITNAFNLIDGSDGVAGGAVVFASATLAAVSLMNGHHLAAMVALAITGSTLGFLFFNFPPATIFLGDCGSLFLGFTLAGLGVLSAQTGPATLGVAIPVMAFGFPILDTCLAIMRRFLRGQPIFNADRGHIHHRLRDFGHSPRQIAMVVYAACAACALLSLLLINTSQSGVGLIFLVSGVVVWGGVQRLNIPELIEVQRILGRGFRQRVAIARNVRVREAVARLSQTTSREGAFAALAHAFTNGEFEHVDLYLESDANDPDDCITWSWGQRPISDDDAVIQIRLPFLDERGVCGHLSLWRAVAPDHLLLTDIRLITSELQPACVKALRRQTAVRRLKTVRTRETVAAESMGVVVNG